ncbi:MAG: tripartite tricarboxylate transporter substrate binding protein [Betaproteobacteria bacterium]|nr:tripartite tricarboxylate transporter substrate binding protein [Betaproteobacteria bacterium]
MLAATLASALPALDATAAQPVYPLRPIRLIVAQSAGGTADFVARTYTQRLTEILGQQFVIDNRPGGAGIVGTETVVNAVPDGYTLLLAPTAHAINPNFVAKLPYDTRRDVASISLLSAGYNLLVVNQTSAMRSVGDIIAAARAQPGRLRYASSGAAGATHLTTELFRLMAGIDLLHVPYKGAPAALTAVIGNECDMSFGSMASALPLVRGGRLRALAITAPERWQNLPEIPTVAEAGVPGYESSSWQALFGPAKLPPAIIDRLYQAIALAAKNPDTIKRLTAEGIKPLATTPKELDTHIARELDKWVKVTKAAGLNVH